MKTKRDPLVFLFALVLGIALFGCKKEPQEILTPKITNDKVEANATTATFSWTVDWPGKLISVVEMSENEDMSDSRYYGSEEETENHDFTVIVTGLKTATKYYFRYVVWNQFYVDNKVVMDRKVFTTLPPPPMGAANGTFSISSTRKVFFSQGNLQYQASTNTWRFAEHQWDYVGTHIPDEDGYIGGTVFDSDNKDVSSTYSGWIDLFGWGTSGYNHGATCYQPWSTSDFYSDYWAYGNNTCNLYDRTGKADWGYNAISNGGNRENSGWRTLTKDEWEFVFSTRNSSMVNGVENARYVMAKIDDVQGVILFPDSYTHPTGLIQPKGINGSENTEEIQNNYNQSDWMLMEEMGAVFLPVAGNRNGTSIDNICRLGFYWSASRNCNSIVFNYYSVNTGSHPFWVGRSVRLVQDNEK